MINKHRTLPFTRRGYFFNPRRCVLFTLKLSYKLAKARRLWEKAGSTPETFTGVGNGAPTAQSCGRSHRPGRYWLGKTEELFQASRSVGRPRRLWSSPARLGTMKCSGVGSRCDFDLFFAICEKSEIFNRYENHFPWSLADWVWIKTPLRAQRVISCFS